MKRFKTSTLGLILASCIANTTMAVQTNSSGKYIWDFLGGSSWPTGYTSSTGKPSNMIWAKSEYDSSFFSRVTAALPESRVNTNFLSGDNGSNITLKEVADVYITFIHEGAGYSNSFGFFTFEKDQPPTSKFNVREKIIFPNLSYPHLDAGHRIHLGRFPAGKTIGFFLAANGFSNATGVKNTAVPHYYSLKGLNPEPTDILRQHTVLLRDSTTSEIILGVEDLPRQTGDNDFNDAVFSIKVTPYSALETNNINLIPAIQDSDADGVSDSADEFPNDFQAASSSYYPSSQGYSTLAFEDNWPNMGDYDLNDLVVRERLQIIYNSRGQVSRLKIQGFIDARGAADHNGFGLRLMDLSNVAVSSASITIAGQTQNLTAETKQTNPVFLLWNDTHQYTNTGETGSCSHFNTVKTCTPLAPVPFSLDLNLLTPVSNFNHAKLDFFLFKTDYRGREIHFADYPPTDRFDVTQFGKKDDRSNSQLNRYFRNEQNLPWAIKISSSWRYPREYIDIVWAYPQYETWVESSGTQALDWYSDTSKPNHTY